MTDNHRTCVDPYLDSFAESFAAANYKAGTIATYRSIIRKLGQVMDAEGIEPSVLTFDQAERLGRMVPRKHGQTICPHNLARRFTAHLIDIGVATPVPLSERVYEFTWQMDAILFWDSFQGRWLRGTEFHYPERPANLPALKPLESWPKSNPRDLR